MIKRNSNSWDVIQLARSIKRTSPTGILKSLFRTTQPLGTSDSSVLIGVGEFGNQSFAYIANVNKYPLTKPNGFRDMERMMRLAQRWNLPLLSIIDPPGACPSIQSEIRGQAWAISSAINLFSCIKVPTISLVLGEACSGGGIVLLGADFILTMENAYVTVISPEGCSSILFGNIDHTVQMSEQLKLTSSDLLKRSFIDEIIPENHDIYIKDRLTIKRMQCSIIEALNRTPSIYGNRFKRSSVILSDEFISE